MRTLILLCCVGIVACTKPADKETPKQQVSAATTPQPKGGGEPQSDKSEPAKAESRLKNTQNMTPRELAEFNIAFYTKEIAKRPKETHLKMALAKWYVQLAETSGTLAPYKQALAALEGAEQDVKFKAPVLFARARALTAIHRNAEAAKVLAKVDALGQKQPEFLRLDGQLKLARGDYKAAEARFATLAAGKVNAAMGKALLGHLADKKNEHKKSLSLYAEAIKMGRKDDVGFRSWVMVLRGLAFMHRGRFVEARHHFKKAVKVSPTILAMEHLAEIQGRLKQTEAAIETYEQVLKRTRNPEFLDALAGVIEKRDAKRAAKLIAEAKQAYEKMLKTFPEAAYGHAIDFYLGSGKDPKRALELAEKDAKLRPNGNSWLHLAEARLASGDAKGAAAAIKKALATPLRSADLHWVAAEIHGKLGQAAEAAKQRKLALAINPRQEDM